MSPSVWFANRAVLNYIERDGTPPGHLYVDTGTDEGTNTLRDARQLANLLTRKGYGDDRFRFVEEPGGKHSEADWARRLVAALEFLLRPVADRRRVKRR
jgi:predicted alpha/beta superfamily hydrolase